MEFSLKFPIIFSPPQNLVEIFEKVYNFIGHKKTFKEIGYKKNSLKIIIFDCQINYLQTYNLLT